MDKSHNCYNCSADIGLIEPTYLLDGLSFCHKCYRKFKPRRLTNFFGWSFFIIALASIGGVSLGYYLDMTEFGGWCIFSAVVACVLCVLCMILSIIIPKKPRPWSIS